MLGEVRACGRRRGARGGDVLKAGWGRGHGEEGGKGGREGVMRGRGFVW